MINTYTLLAVSDVAPFVNTEGAPVDDVKLNTVGADALINFMLGEGEDLATDFGFDKERLSYMYNFFVLCGPKEDPANVKGAADVLSAFKANGGVIK